MTFNPKIWKNYYNCLNCHEKRNYIEILLEYLDLIQVTFQSANIAHFFKLDISVFGVGTVTDDVFCTGASVNLTPLAHPKKYGNCNKKIIRVKLFMVILNNLFTF